MAYNLKYIQDQTAQMQRQGLVNQMQGGEETPAPAPAAQPSTPAPDFAAPTSTAQPAEPPRQYVHTEAQPAAPAQNSQANIDAFWDQVTNQHRNDFSDAELQGWGVSRLSPDKYSLGNGQTVDTVRDIGGPNEARGQWTISGGQPGQNGQGVASGGSGGAGGGAAGGGASDFQAQIRALLLQQLQGLSQPVDKNDPQIKGEFEAQSRVIDRNREARRGAAAERAAFQGLLNGGQSSGAFDADVASGYEDAGQQKTSVQASLFARVAEQKKQQLTQLLSQAIQSGDAEAARAVQMQMAQIDAELRRQSLGQQQSQFNDNFGLQAADFQYRKDRDLATYGIGE